MGAWENCFSFLSRKVHGLGPCLDSPGSARRTSLQPGIHDRVRYTNPYPVARSVFVTFLTRGLFFERARWFTAVSAAC